MHARKKLVIKIVSHGNMGIVVYFSIRGKQILKLLLRLMVDMRTNEVTTGILEILLLFMWKSVWSALA